LPPPFPLLTPLLKLAHFLRAYAPHVDSVSLDGKVRAFAEQSTAALGSSTATRWGLDRIDQDGQPLDSLYHYYNMGSEVHAYIIDTVGQQGAGRSGSEWP
jgi:hypothetical protein